MTLTDILFHLNLVSKHHYEDEREPNELEEAIRILQDCSDAGFVSEDGKVLKVVKGQEIPVTADGYLAIAGETYWRIDSPTVGTWGLFPTAQVYESCTPEECYDVRYTTYPRVLYGDKETCVEECRKQIGSFREAAKKRDLELARRDFADAEQRLKVLEAQQ